MSTTMRHLRHLRKRGIEPRLVGWEEVDLECDAELDPEVLEKARELKQQILAELRAEQLQKLEERINDRGWVLVDSTVLDEVVVFARDDSISVPRVWGSLVRYTLDELKLLAGSTAEGLRQLHAVKRVIGGVVREERLDPRPDLCTDSWAWEKLLEMVRAQPIHGNLRGLRCCGARLGVEDGRWQLGFWPGEGFSSASEFAKACAEHLDSGQLAQALARLAVPPPRGSESQQATLDLGAE